MSASQLLAIDVGTQSARAIVFDAQGRLLARAQKVFEPTYHSPQPGWAEQHPQTYWDAVVACVRELWPAGIKPADIAGLALTTQRCASTAAATCCGPRSCGSTSAAATTRRRWGRCGTRCSRLPARRR
jgi:sugar (pentulose or hexulose) kinase